MSTTDYLKQVREASAYPTFRSIAALALSAFLLIGGLLSIGGLIVAFGQGNLVSGGIGVGVGLVICVIGKVLHEAMLMLADLADSTLEANARKSG